MMGSFFRKAADTITNTWGRIKPARATKTVIRTFCIAAALLCASALAPNVVQATVPSGTDLQLVSTDSGDAEEQIRKAEERIRKAKEDSERYKAQSAHYKKLKKSFEQGQNNHTPPNKAKASGDIRQITKKEYEIGRLLADRMMKESNTRYAWGGKSSLGRDCSGFVEHSYKGLVDRELIKGASRTQIASLAKVHGYIDENDLYAGNIPAGSVIGVIKGKSGKVSHIAAVVFARDKKTGRVVKHVAEMRDPREIGPVYTELNDWIAKRKQYRLCAVNPITEKTVPPQKLYAQLPYPELAR